MMKQLNRMVTAYLDFAENMTLRHIPLTMQDWEKRPNSFIEMFDYGIVFKEWKKRVFWQNDSRRYYRIKINKSI